MGHSVRVRPFLPLLIVFTCATACEVSPYDASRRIDLMPNAVVEQSALGVGRAVEFLKPEGFPHFGRQVAVTNNDLLVAAGTLGGETHLYAYTKNGEAWSLQQEIALNDTTAVELGAVRLVMEGDSAFLSARGYLHPGPPEGRVFVLERAEGSWSVVDVWTEPNGDSRYFGDALALDGDRLLVGTPCQGVAEACNGAVYLFRRSAGLWSLAETLTPGDDVQTTTFGMYGALRGETLVIVDDLQTETVHVWLYRLESGVPSLLQVLNVERELPAAPLDYFHSGSIALHENGLVLAPTTPVAPTVQFFCRRHRRDSSSDRSSTSRPFWFQRCHTLATTTLSAPRHAPAQARAFTVISSS
jgi:hypothetical protein